MSDFHLYVLALISGISLFTILLALRRKKHFSSMSGMIVSMFLGMNIGLTAGITFGTVYQGDLFLSTILGMGYGIVAGCLCGACFGFLSSLEGTMSGLMGGMMGAMLGEMIPADQANVLIKFFLLLSFCTIFLMVTLSTSNNATIENMDWLFKPILTSLLVGGVLLLGNSFEMEKAESKALPQETQSESHNDPDTKTEINKIVIEMSDLKYSPKEMVIEKNKPITVELKNTDQIEHDLEIKDVSFKMVSESKHQHGGEKNVLHLHAEPQKTSEMTFSINERGTYEFYCTIPGHKENGMVGQLVVK
ncbi:cupredoxin domain-containing protein [Paenisporosarcina quisquiliarum]|uniref:cupredoxin domain-containing protein n=1 Tax=Paenisporosarcina quisquiliarum TaxID=365346 RepID=UPI0037354FF3